MITDVRFFGAFASCSALNLAAAWARCCPDFAAATNRSATNLLPHGYAAATVV